MARYKHIDTSPRLLAVDLEAQLMPGTFEHAFHRLLEHDIDLLAFDGEWLWCSRMKKQRSRNYCGQRGSLNGYKVQRSQRRPIRYMKLLLESSEYQRALAEHRDPVR